MSLEPLSPLARRARRRIAWRLLPFLILLYVVAFIDRVNVTYAKLTMTSDLGFSDAVYGFGAGIFFIGYVLLEIPGTLLVERWSARLWISRIMISWGIIAVLMGFIQNKTQFYWLRFLLGMGEAGFFPGIIVYLSHWFRARDRAKAMALFMSAGPLANLFASPVSGWIMKHDWLGLAGWRWVFILEGFPAVVLGIVVLFYMTDRPQKARWLPDDERDWIVGELEREKQARTNTHGAAWWKAFKEPPVLLLSFAYFTSVTGAYGFVMFLPTMLQSLSGLPVFSITLLAMLPYLCALGVMQFVGWNSDRTGDRIWHTAVLMLASGAGLLGTVLVRGNLPFALAMFCVTCAGVFGKLPGFWPLPSMYLSGSGAAAAVGLINSLGNVGGFVGPYLVGEIKTRTGSFLGGSIFLAVMLGLAAMAILCLKRFPPAQTGRTPESRG